MAATLTAREQEFVARSNATIAAMDQSKVKNKTMEDDSSKQYKANKNRLGRRWALFKMSHPDATLECTKDLEDFMLFVGTGMKGKKGDDFYFRRRNQKGKDCDEKKQLNAVYTSVRNAWNNFCAWCGDNGHPISPSNKEHMTKYNKQFLKKAIHLRLYAREAKFSGEFHYGILSVYRWRRSHVLHARPRVRFVQHHITTTNFYSAGRIGEFAKSDGRDEVEVDAGYDAERDLRGLHFQDVCMFAMFNKDKRKTELCIRLTKDEKGKGDNPQDRGHCTFYEDLKGPLYQNNFLFSLSMLLARMPFRDYQSLDRKELLQKLLDIEIREAQRFAPIHWKDEFLGMPFFECAAKDSGKVEKASAVHYRHKEDCYSAGMPNPPNFHDVRRFGINEADKKHSESSRMRLGGHSKAGMFRGHYQPRETIDGAANFLRLEEREDVLEISQQLNIPYIPNLLQSLPAKNLYQVQQSKEYRDITEQIEIETSPRKVKNLKQRLESLKQDTLKWLRVEQGFDDVPRYEHEVYSRVRFMFSAERLRLENNLFQETELRSELGIQTVLDLTAYYLQPREVSSRPGLEPSKCSCLGKGGYDWKHVYECHQTSQARKHGFAEFCFICNIWMYNVDDWECHCQHHVDDLENFPRWVDPLIYDGVLASAGFCECCLIKSQLPASERMRQWKWRHKWAEHYMEHFSNPKTEHKCRHGSFESILEFKFHLYDHHGVRIPNLWSDVRKPKDRLRSPPRRTTNCRAELVLSKEAEKDDIKSHFHNITTNTMARSDIGRQSSVSRRIAPEVEIISSSRDELSSSLELEAVGCDLSPKLEHASNVAPKAQPPQGRLSCQKPASEQLRDPDLKAENDVACRPCHSTYSTTRTTESGKEASLRAIPSLDCDFIDIDSVLCASTFDSGLSLLRSRSRRAALETIDLTSIDDRDGSDCEQANCNDSGYVSSESPTPEFLGFADRGDYVEEITEGMKVEGPDPNRVEDYSSEHFSPGHHRTLSDGFSPIDPSLINPEAYHEDGGEVTLASKARDSNLYKLANCPKSIDEALHSTEVIICHKRQREEEPAPLLGSNKWRKLFEEDDGRARSSTTGLAVIDPVDENSMPIYVETLFSSEDELSNYPDIHGAVSGDASSAPYYTSLDLPDKAHCELQSSSQSLFQDSRIACKQSEIGTLSQADCLSQLGAMSSHEGVDDVIQNMICAQSDDLYTHSESSAAYNEPNDEGEWNVEGIVGCDVIDGAVHYEVKWQGWSSSDNTWEPLENLTSCMELVEEYRSRRKRPRGRPRKRK